MSFKRQIAPEEWPKGDELTSHLIGIGFRLQGKKTPHCNIEDAIFAASSEGVSGDLRVLSLLVDWLEIHYQRVNVDRLYRLISGVTDKRISAFWTAIARWKKSDQRFKRISKLYRGKRIDLLTTGTDFHIKRKGEDSRFKSSPLRVPEGAGLRHRPSDILKPHELAKIHLPYYYRLMIGPSYRADMWAHLELNPELGASELARICYGSFATAWQVKREWDILKEAA